jgi:Protein of unknown function (DUF3618)
MSRDPDVPPVSPDRPYVDATDRTPEDLRAEIEQLNDPGLDDAEANVRRAREELRATVSELAERLDVPAHARRGAARARDAAVAAARAHARLIAAGTGVLLLALVVRRRSAQDR